MPADEPRPAILVVDDQPANRFALTQLLARLPAEIVTAPSGNAALIATLHRDFALVLLDVQMPAMDGYEVARWLRHEERTRHTPIIFITANYHQQDDQLRGYASGAVDYLVKPLVETVLLAKVQAFLELDQHRRSLARQAEELAREVRQRQAAEQALAQHRDQLEQTVAQRTAELQQANDLLRAEIAQHAQAQQRLALFRELADQAGDALLVLDPEDGTIVDGNGALARFSPAAALPSALPACCPDLPPWPTLVADLRRQPDRLITATLTLPGAPPIPIELTARLVATPLGERLVAVLRDIRARLALERQLLQAQKLEAVGRLAGGVAHDFNNLLTVILGFSQLLGSQPLPAEKVAHGLRQITEAGQRAKGLTTRLLAFSRQEAQAQQQLDLNQLLGGVTEMLRRLIREDIVFATQPAPTPLPVRGDPGQLEQVILNLVVNARDAIPHHGGITVTTALCHATAPVECHHRQLPRGDYAQLTVADTGTGIAPEILAHLFEPFFTTKARGSGTGLGLAMVYAIVERHQGDLRVHSEPGRGTTFHCYLPLASAPCAAAAAPPASQPLVPGSETILVVEDEAQLRAMVAEILTTCGYRVLTAANGQEALALLAQPPAPVHLVVTDVVMPTMGGGELLRHLRADHPELRVLLMSGHVDRRESLPADLPLLPKPFTCQALTGLVRQLLDAPVAVAVR